MSYAGSTLEWVLILVGVLAEIPTLVLLNLYHPKHITQNIIIIHYFTVAALTASVLLLQDCCFFSQSYGETEFMEKILHAFPTGTNYFYHNSKIPSH